MSNRLIWIVSIAIAILLPLAFQPAAVLAAMILTFFDNLLRVAGVKATVIAWLFAFITWTYAMRIVVGFVARRFVSR